MDRVLEFPVFDADNHPLTGLIDLIGADRVCFGSDYPHAEGLAEPLSWLDQLAGLDVTTVERIASGNMYELLGVPRPA